MTSLGRRLPQQGPVKGRWGHHHDRSRKAVFLRCKGICEAPGCSSTQLDWAHLFGRRHLIEEPWCSSPELTAGICRSHHRAIDQYTDEPLRRLLQWRAVVRLAEKLNKPVPSQDMVDAVQAIRELIDEAMAEW